MQIRALDTGEWSQPKPRRVQFGAWCTEAKFTCQSLVLNNRHTTTDLQQHHTTSDRHNSTQQHTTQHWSDAHTTLVCNKQFFNDTLYHERNTTPLPSVCLMRATPQTGNMPRPMHLALSGSCCGALPLRCGVVVWWLWWWLCGALCVCCVLCVRVDGVRVCVLVVSVFMGLCVRCFVLCVCGEVVFLSICGSVNKGIYMCVCEDVCVCVSASVCIILSLHVFRQFHRFQMIHVTAINDVPVLTEVCLCVCGKVSCLCWCSLLCVFVCTVCVRVW